MSSKAGKRYAKSILSLAKEQKKVDEIYQDMLLIYKICKENRELVLVLENPIVRGHNKAVILDKIFSKHISKLSQTFLSLLVTKGREGLIDDIADQYISLYKEYKNIETAHITTSVALDAKLKKKILETLGKTSKKEIELVENVDADIIGGMILRIGDRQVDQSIRRKLNNYKRAFSENPQINN